MSEIPPDHDHTFLTRATSVAKVSGPIRAIQIISLNGYLVLVCRDEMMPFNCGCAERWRHRPRTPSLLRMPRCVSHTFPARGHSVGEVRYRRM